MLPRDVLASTASNQTRSQRGTTNGERRRTQIWTTSEARRRAERRERLRKARSRGACVRYGTICFFRFD